MSATSEVDSILARQRFPELSKVRAFFRRDALIAWSYRTAFVSDAAGLVAQALIFALVAPMVSPAAMPVINGRQPSYVSFVVVGVALGGFVHLGLSRVTSAIRTEQLLGTLEVLFLTRTRSTTVQVGLVAYDLVYVPVRTALFLIVTVVLFGAEIEFHQLHVAMVVLLAFLPIVWGLGAATAAGVLAFRRGTGLIGLGAGILNVAGGAYVPIEVLPGWLQAVAAVNPVAIALRAMREVLLGGGGWGDAVGELAILVPMSVVTFGIGMAMFEFALRRERRRGTLGQY